MEELLHLDVQLFQFINHELELSFFEPLLIAARNKMVWIPLYILILAYLVLKRQQYHLIAIVFLVLTVVITDQVSSQVLKKSVERPRPCHLIEDNFDVDLRVRCGKGYSWPSSHACNHFGIAVFLVLLFVSSKGLVKFLLILWASLISFAQVFVGVHYPIDVISGAFIGSLVAGITYYIYKYLHLNYFLKEHRHGSP